MNTWGLKPEVKQEAAQMAVRATLQGIANLLSFDVKDEMAADEVEMLSCQLQLAAVNLKMEAKALREVEAERVFLAKELERSFLRFEPEPFYNPALGQPFIEGGASA